MFISLILYLGFISFWFHLLLLDSRYSIYRDLCSFIMCNLGLLQLFITFIMYLLHQFLIYSKSTFKRRFQK